jgi:DNA polymerase-3 subunit epsilon
MNNTKEIILDETMKIIEKPAQGQFSLETPAELAAYAQALSAHPDFQVLQRFAPKAHYHIDAPETLCRGVILDTESTGTDIHVDKIIELGMILFEYCPTTGKVYRVLRNFNQLEDPGMPIPAEASAVNGISDEMVAGKIINDDDVLAFIENVNIFIAHNSSFDRAMLERRFPVFENLAWGCSLQQVDWAAEGIRSQKLDYIAYKLGYFHDAHRAESDCLALLEALQRPLPVSAAPALKQIIDCYQSGDHRIWALEAKFDLKDILKKRGYRWGDGNNGTEKAWYIEVSEDAYAAEIAWLKSAIYGNRNFRVAVDSVNAFNRFSVRRGKRNVVFC